MASYKDIFEQVEAHAQDCADATINAWVADHSQAVGIDQALTLSAEVWAAVIAAVQDALACDENCDWADVARRAAEAHAQRLLELASERYAAVRRPRPRVGSGGAAATPEEIATLVTAKGPVVARALFGWSSLGDVDDLVQESVIVILDKVTRLFDPSYGLTWERYALMTLRYYMREQRRRLAIRAAREVHADDMFESADSDERLERVPERLDAIVDAAEFDEYVRIAPEFKPSERSAYFARRAGGEAGSRAEQAAYSSALAKIRRAFAIDTSGRRAA